MLILKYFLTVGAVLIAGLLALNAHLATPGQISMHKSTTASLPMVTPAPKAEKNASLDVAPPQKLKKSAAPTHRSKPPKSRHRASR
jgi:hypothetical protein